MGNRVVYVNRRGMLITDEKLFHRNPFGAGIDAGKYVAIVWAADDATDEMVREMEPPTHESIEYKRIGDPDRRNEIQKQLQDISGKIRKHIRERLDLETFDKRTELRELSNIIPYVSNPDKDNGDDKDSSQLKQPIEVRKIRTGTGMVKAEEAEEPEDEDSKGTGSSGGSGSSKPPRGRAPDTRKIVSNMRNVRVVRHGTNSMRIAFESKTGASKFVIKPVGEEHKDEPPITIASATGISGTKSVEVLGENTIRVNCDPGKRVVLDVQPGILHEYTAYTILEYRARRTAK